MTFSALQQRHEALLARQSKLTADDLRRRTPAAGQLADDVRQFMADVVTGSEGVAEPRERDLLRAWLRYWATFTFEWSGVFPKTDLRPAALTGQKPIDYTQPGSQTAASGGGLPRWAIWLAAALSLLLLAWAMTRVLPAFNQGHAGDATKVPPVETALPPTATSDATRPTTTPTRRPPVTSPGQTIDNNNVSRVQELGRVDAHSGGASAVAFDPGRNEVATAGMDGVLRFWEVPSLVLRHETADQPGWVRALAYSPTGGLRDGLPLILTGGNDRILRAYDTDTRQPFAEFQPSSSNSGFIFATAFSPDGRLIAAGYGDGLARIWDVAGGTEVARVPAERAGSTLAAVPAAAAAITDLAFRKGGGLALALAGEPGVLVTDSTFTQILCAPQIGPATAVAFSPNGEMLAVGTERGTLVLVAVDGCRTMQEVVAHDGGVADIAFSPDGGWLVTGGGDGTIKFFTAEGRLTATLKAGAPVTAVAVEYAAGRVASVDTRGQLVLWGVPTE